MLIHARKQRSMLFIYKSKLILILHMLKQAIGLPETMDMVAAENEEHADDQSEPLALESIITKHTLSEGLVTMESSTKSSYDVEELHEIPESHFVENSEIKDDGKTALEEAIYIKEATDVELPNSDTEGNYIFKIYTGLLFLWNFILHPRNK